MALFNKALARIGIGAARVDAKLVNDEFRAGETIEGIVEVYGGNVEQKIDSIYLRLFTTYVKERDDKNTSRTLNLIRLRLTTRLRSNHLKPSLFLLPFSYLMIRLLH